MPTCSRCQHQNTDGARFCVHCGALLDTSGHGQVPQDAMIGRILSERYRIVAELGQGGMGKVYRAEQKMGTAVREVAIKVLHPDLSKDPQIVARFQRECETVIGLHHPNTVRFFDFGELQDGTLYIVMELIEGESLAAVIDRNIIDESRAEHLLDQICGSLHEAHELGIVHRDLKPDNVLLTDRAGQNDFVKVLDFGIAKQGIKDGKSSSLTKAGTILGTPPYMSPEQFRGNELDRRSDIYSVGVMAYEMLTGRMPFEANTPWEWATKHLTEEPRSFETLLETSSISETKKTAIMRALSKDPNVRQSTATEFLKEFQGTASTARPLEHTRLWLWLVSAMLLAFAGYVIWAPGDREADVHPVTAPQPKVDVSVGNRPSKTTADPTNPSGTQPIKTPPTPPESANVPPPVKRKNPSIKKPKPTNTKTEAKPTAGSITLAEITLQAAQRALNDNRLHDGVKYLRQAQRQLGTTPKVASLRAELSRQGSNKIAVLVKSGQCVQAQSTYRTLAQVNAETLSKRHFLSDACTLP